MSNNLRYIWQGDEPKIRIPHFKILFTNYQDNYAEFAGKNFDSLTSQQQQYWRDIGGELIKAADAARDKAYKAGESVAHVSFELPEPDRSLEPGGKPPRRAVPKEKKSTKRFKPYERKTPSPVVRACDDPPQIEQSQPQPPVIPIPPPPAAAYQLQYRVQYQPPTAFTSVAPILPQPAAVPLEYYQYNDPTCPIPEGDLPGPRSDSLLCEWIAYCQKAGRAKAEAEEEEARQMARAVQVKVMEVVKRQEEDIRLVKAQEAMDVDWSQVIDPALMAD